MVRGAEDNMSYWPHYEHRPLLYIGDGYDRCIVSPIRGDGPNCVKIDKYRLQIFRWPDGSEHAVPKHCVVLDSPEIRKELGL